MKTGAPRETSSYNRQSTTASSCAATCTEPDGHLIELGQANRDFLKERGLLE